MRFLFLVLSLAGNVAFAGPNSDLLTTYTWHNFHTHEPTIKIRAYQDISFYNGVYTRKETCLYNELGLGDDVVITLTSPITAMDENTFTLSTPSAQTVTNNQGQVCTAFITAGVSSYSVLWGRRQTSMQGRTFDRVEQTIETTDKRH